MQRYEPRSERLLPWVKVNPTKGRWSPAKAGLWLGGWASDTRMSLSSTSKLDVSVGEDTCVRFILVFISALKSFVSSYMLIKHDLSSEGELYYLWNIRSCGLGDVFPVDANKVRMRFEVHDAVLAQSHLVPRVMVRVKMTIMTF